MTTTTTTTRAPDVKLEAMSSSYLRVFHQEGEPTIINRASEGRKGGVIPKPGKVQWDPTDSKPRPGRRIYPAGTYFSLLRRGSPEETALWGAWFPE
jgi:hypothetical protein